MESILQKKHKGNIEKYVKIVSVSVQSMYICKKSE